MTAAIQFVIDVLSLGGAYALMALGLVIVYGILRLVNFAYGELIMVAGYTLYLVGDSPLPWLTMAMLVIGGPGTVTGAVVGTYVVTLAFETLRALEAYLNRARIFTEQVVGLTEVVLALAMIGVLVLRPGGLVATREVGTWLLRRRAKRGDEP